MKRRILQVCCFVLAATLTLVSQAVADETSSPKRTTRRLTREVSSPQVTPDVEPDDSWRTMAGSNLCP